MRQQHRIWHCSSAFSVEIGDELLDPPGSVCPPQFYLYKPIGRNLYDKHFHTVSIDGLDIFYREAGSRSNPTILLLHGFPTSSHMFRNLIPALADRFHLVCP